MHDCNQACFSWLHQSVVWAWVGEPNLDIASMAGISADKLSVRALVKDKSLRGT